MFMDTALSSISYVSIRNNTKPTTIYSISAEAKVGKAPSLHGGELTKSLKGGGLWGGVEGLGYYKPTALSLSLCVPKCAPSTGLLTE